MDTTVVLVSLMAAALIARLCFALFRTRGKPEDWAPPRREMWPLRLTRNGYRISLLVGIVLMAALPVASLAMSTYGDAGREVPAGTCVDLVGDRGQDNYASFSVVDCSSPHTHVVTGTARDGECPLGAATWPTWAEPDRDYCLSYAGPVVTPYPGGLTAP